MTNKDAIDYKNLNGQFPTVVATSIPEGATSNTGTIVGLLPIGAVVKFDGRESCVLYKTENPPGENSDKILANLTIQ